MHLPAQERSWRVRAVRRTAVAALAVSFLTAPGQAFAGQVLSWGDNHYGQLGTGSRTASDLPVLVGGAGDASALEAGGASSFAVLPGGVGSAWGANEVGQLGDGTTANKALPQELTGLSEVHAISAGAHHTLAALADGTVRAWGSNFEEELGPGASGGSDVPLSVSGLSGVVGVAAGADQSLALLEDGHVMAWGGNTWGQLGNGTYERSATPVEVKGLTGVKAIAAGIDYSLALLENGHVMAWGLGNEGQLGQGTKEPYTTAVPLEVMGLTGVASISAGGDCCAGGLALALREDGTVMQWGSGRKTPYQVSGVADATAIVAGGEHALALLGDGTVKAWGSDLKGQLGDGSFANQSRTSSVCALYGVTAIAAGDDHSLAYLPGPEALTPGVTAIAPGVGAMSGGTAVLIAGPHLGEATAVRFGSSGAAFKVLSSDSIEAISPPGAEGTVDVTVGSAAGTSVTCTADGFRYAPPPVITKVTPKKAKAIGGQKVIVAGSRFTEVTDVRFGSVSATSFHVVSSTKIEAISPPTVAGTLDISVVTSGGLSAISSADKLTMTAAITELLPHVGPAAGGTTVTVKGFGFAPGSGLTSFLFASSTPTSVSCASSTECTLVTPAHHAGTLTVTATVNGQKAKSKFTYQ